MEMEKQRTAFGLIAHPVGHSLSPVMHNRAFTYLRLPYHYHSFDVRPEQLKEAVQALKVLRVGGVNVSIPHKETIIPYLDEIDEEALTIGAVNTIVINENNKLKGYNTDGEGYVLSLQKEKQIDIKEQHVVILGAGGAAKGIAVYLLKHGCLSITIANRTLHKAEQMTETLRAYAKKAKLSKNIAAKSLDELQTTGFKQYTLIINTTSVGMWPHVEAVPISLTNVQPNCIVSDIVYNPLKTAFLKQAEALGCIIHEGVGMFVHQGALAFEKFTGIEAPVDMMHEVVIQHLMAKEE